MSSFFFGVLEMGALYGYIVADLNFIGANSKFNGANSNYIVNF